MRMSDPQRGGFWYNLYFFPLTLPSQGLMSVNKHLLHSYYVLGSILEIQSGVEEYAIINIIS